MATVYRARQDNLQRTVAIKFLDDLHARDATYVERFRREALAASELNHRNIVTIHEFGDFEEQLYLVMEMVDGFDLQVVLNDRPGLPVEIVLLLLEEIVEGLAASHSKGIIHRDIKPANVLISRGGDVKITDFGLARSILPAVEQQNLTGEMLLGTPFYMSPEQIHSLPLDSRTDVFSLGVMSYELVTGRLPFRGETMVDTLHAITSVPMPPLELGKPFAVVERLIERAIARDPELRIASMRAFAVEIGACFETIDPHRVLARRRRTILRRFGADRAAFLASVADLDYEARLRRYEELETGIPLPKVIQSDLGAKLTLKATSNLHSKERERTSDPVVAVAARGTWMQRAKTIALVLGVAAAMSVVIVGSVPRQPEIDSRNAVHASATETKAANRKSSEAIQSATSTIAPEILDVESPPIQPNARRTPERVELQIDDSRVSTISVPASKPSPPVEFPVQHGASHSLESKSHTSSPLPSSAASYVKIRCSPPGDVYLNDQLMISKAEVALLEVSAKDPSTVTIRHPELFGVRSWSPVVGPGDTLELGHRVATGTLRIAVEPPGAAAVHLQGRETGDETPSRKTVAAGNHLVQVVRPGWIVQKVTISDRTTGTAPREVIPPDPFSFQGVSVEILAEHDQKLVFLMAPKVE